MAIKANQAHTGDAAAYGGGGVGTPPGQTCAWRKATVS